MSLFGIKGRVLSKGRVLIWQWETLVKNLVKFPFNSFRLVVEIYADEVTTFVTQSELGASKSIVSFRHIDKQCLFSLYFNLPFLIFCFDLEKGRDFNVLIQREYEPVTFAKFHASQALTFRKHENLEDKQLVVNFKEQQCSIDYCEILTFACFRFTIRVKMF